MSKIIKIMRSTDINTQLVNSYFGLLKHLSTSNKLDLITKLTQSVKAETDKDKSRFFKAYGAWDQVESADEMIACIRDSRTFNRNTEEF